MTNEAQSHFFPCPPQPALGVPAHRMHYWAWQPQSGRAPQHIVFCVHGLTRQGRDFAPLAQTLTQQDVLVLAPDVAGRGHSDWLSNPLHYQAPVYGGDMLALLRQVRAQYAGVPIVWLGTSMGGLIALAASALAPQFCTRLILNDVAPRLEWAALARIGGYVQNPPRFATQEEGLRLSRVLSSPFGALTEAEFTQMNTPQLRHEPQEPLPWCLHYDPAIGVLPAALTQPMALQGEALLWRTYDALRMPCLLLRGENSDLVSASTAAEMQTRGPRAQVFVCAQAGHAPALVRAHEQEAVARFALALDA